MLVITATCGRASAASAAISPGALVPISITAERVACRSRSSVSGTPSALLNERSLATTDPRDASAAATSSLVVVLPLLPVMPTTSGQRAPSSVRRT